MHVVDGSEDDTRGLLGGVTGSENTRKTKAVPGSSRCAGPGRAKRTTTVEYVASGWQGEDKGRDPAYQTTTTTKAWVKRWLAPTGSKSFSHHCQ